MNAPKVGHVFVEVIGGVEGPSLYISDDASGERCAGPKPWGGGKTLHRFEVSAETLIKLATSYATKETDE